MDKYNREQIKFYVKLNTLIEVEIEIIKLRAKYMNNKVVDEVLTRLQNTINGLKPYQNIDTTKIDINMTEERNN